jgi:hypothetical protein
MIIQNNKHKKDGLKWNIMKKLICNTETEA